MHGPPLTLTEIAEMIGRDIAELRHLGISLNSAVAVVAERRHMTDMTVRRLLARQQACKIGRGPARDTVV